MCWTARRNLREAAHVLRGSLVTPLVVFGIVLVAGLVVTLPAYLRLLRFMAADHPDAHARMGRPSIWNGSPTKSFALQRFISEVRRGATASPRVSSLCRLLGVVVPVYLMAILATLGWALVVALAQVTTASGPPS